MTDQMQRDFPKLVSRHHAAVGKLIAHIQATDARGPSLLAAPAFLEAAAAQQAIDNYFGVAKKAMAKEAPPACRWEEVGRCRAS